MLDSCWLERAVGAAIADTVACPSEDVHRPGRDSGIVVVEPRAVEQLGHVRQLLQLVVALVEPVALVVAAKGLVVVEQPSGVELASSGAFDFDDSALPGWRDCFERERSLHSFGIHGAQFDPIRYAGIDQTMIVSI